jgi:hypothetical protein
MTGSQSDIVTIPYDQAYEAGFEDMPRRVPDISKIRGLVGYEPNVQLDEILTRVIDYSGRRNDRDTVSMSARSAPDRSHEAVLRQQAKPCASCCSPRRRGRRRRCPRSSRSRAPTSATPSACSARATRCIATRAS